jgi:hypothetical protein
MASKEFFEVIVEKKSIYWLTIFKWVKKIVKKNQELLEYCFHLDSSILILKYCIKWKLCLQDVTLNVTRLQKYNKFWWLYIEAFSIDFLTKIW